MTDRLAPHRQMLSNIGSNLRQHGYDVEQLDYNDRLNAVVVQYAVPLSTADQIEEVLTGDIPETVGAFQGPLLSSEDFDTYSRMIVYVVDSDKKPADRDSRLRWWIDHSWLPKELETPPEELEEPFQRVIDTAKVVDDDGVHDIETEFGFTDL